MREKPEKTVVPDCSLPKLKITIHNSRMTYRSAVHACRVSRVIRKRSKRGRETWKRERPKLSLMATQGPQEKTHKEKTSNGQYLIVWPEKGGLLDLIKFLISINGPQTTSFLESSNQLGAIRRDHRWVILVSIIVRRVLGFLGKPLEWVGIVIEFLINLLSENGEFCGLILHFFTGKVVVPKRNSETFISAMGHLDERVDLYREDDFKVQIGSSAEGSLQIGTRAIMDLCIMSSKLAYENVKVVRNIIDYHWKMHFVEFYNGWNDFQKERSTQVFILCDKPQDANLILISFRGTEPFDADDWSTDVDYSWYDIPELGKVHMGFLEALGLGNRAEVSTFEKHLLLSESSVKDKDTDTNTNGSENSALKSKNIVPPEDEVSAYYAVKTKLKSLLDEHKNAKFVVTGHSLGGALAILFPAVLLLHNEEKLMERLLGVYTFGQPRIGDRQLGMFMEAHVNHPVPKYFRVVYCNDLVPRLPYDDATFLYKHFGLCLYYDSLYAEQNVDEEPNRNYFGMRYLIPEYLNAVWELFRGWIMGYLYGPEYKESWCSIFLRIIGLAIPGVSAHSPTNYLNCIRLGRARVQMSPL